MMRFINKASLSYADTGMWFDVNGLTGGKLLWLGGAWGRNERAVVGAEIGDRHFPAAKLEQQVAP